MTGYDYETNVYADIESYKRLIKKQKDEIAEKEIIVDSLMDSMIRRIHKIIIPYSSKMLHEAWLQQNEATKKERKMYEFIKEDLLERLFEEDERKLVKFKNIMVLGYDACSYDFRFEYKGILFELAIPNVSVATKENVYSMWCGQYVLSYKKAKSMWSSITTSYYLEDIAKAIKEFAEKGEELL